MQKMALVIDAVCRLGDVKLYTAQRKALSRVLLVSAQSQLEYYLNRIKRKMVMPKQTEKSLGHPLQTFANMVCDKPSNKVTKLIGISNDALTLLATLFELMVIESREGQSTLLGTIAAVGKAPFDFSGNTTICRAHDFEKLIAESCYRVMPDGEYAAITNEIPTFVNFFRKIAYYIGIRVAIFGKTNISGKAMIEIIANFVPVHGDMQILIEHLMIQNAKYQIVKKNLRLVSVAATAPIVVTIATTAAPVAAVDYNSCDDNVDITEDEDEDEDDL